MLYLSIYTVSLHVMFSSSTDTRTFYFFSHFRCLYRRVKSTKSKGLEYSHPTDFDLSQDKVCLMRFQ